MSTTSPMNPRILSYLLHAPARLRGLVAPSVLLAGLVLAGGCGKVCSDDGFAWQQDPSCLALITGATEASATEDSNSATEATLGTAEASDSEPTTAGEGGRFCVDKDGDGFGDPGQCTEVPPGETPPDGTVEDDSDCDDGDPHTYPGAAEKDSATECMADLDEDGHGDQDPPGDGGAGEPVPGSDCDDGSDSTFPGAAPKDSETACMKDEDDDDYGDDDPPAGVDGPIEAGSDCDDADAAVFDACSTCVDADMDGTFVDCEVFPPDAPNPDCDDSDPDTFPGSSPKDDPDACMTDADGDDYGDDDPSSPDAVPGSDCDDASAGTFPGAAPKDDPVACMADDDGDDHGDANPKVPGVTPGDDCNDAHPGVNPTDSVLITLPNTSGDISEVDLDTGAFTKVATVDVSGFDLWVPTSVAVSPADRSVVVALLQNSSLATMNYCGAGVPTPLPEAHNKSICGLTYDAENNLFGIDGQLDQLLAFNSDGSLATVTPLTFEGKTLNIGECGMTYDCHQARMLVSDTASDAVYAVNPADGTTEKLASAPGENFGAGLAYEPVSKRVLSCATKSFYSLALDGSNAFTKLKDLQSSADDLEYAPACN
jgi:hypothetical protein